jgi:predicted Zn finger-like uncharacterized protein
MRLICPNCGAQYEVDGSMIPPEGRDVQCSSCAETWFQEPEGGPLKLPDALVNSDNSDTAQDDAQAEPVQSDIPEAPPESQPVSDAVPAEEPIHSEPAPQEHIESDVVQAAEDAAEPVDSAAPAETTADSTADDDVEDSVAPADDEAMQPRKPSEQLEENILGMLKEEAEREVQARRTEETTGLETQPDLGLEQSGDPDRSGVAAHMARMRGDDNDEGEDPQAGPRSDLLPDIEEINSSLRPAAEHEEVQEIEDPAIVEGRQRSGFRMGFTIIILIIAILILAYVFAPLLAQQFPQAERILIAYVDTANSVRDSIERLLGQAIEAMSGSGGTGE